MRTIIGVTAMLALVWLGGPDSAYADDRAEFRGCVRERSTESIQIRTNSDEQITIITTWIGQNDLDNALAVECVTVTAVKVDGVLYAESIEPGDEPNEVNSLTKETTLDREKRNEERRDREEKKKEK